MSEQAREKNLVDNKVQGVLALRVIQHWLLFAAASAFIIVVFQLMTGNPHNSFGEHFREAWNQHAIFALVLLALLPMFVVDIVRLSNRFAGPMTRTCEAMQAIADGDKIEPLKFRKTDFWNDLANDFNQAFQCSLKQPEPEADESDTDSSSVSPTQP